MARRRRPRCFFCKRTLEKPSARSGLRATRDHYPIPSHLGGGATVPCCFTCNNLKGAMTASDWLDFMAAHPGWWRKDHADRHDRWRWLRTPPWMPERAAE